MSDGEVKTLGELRRMLSLMTNYPDSTCLQVGNPGTKPGEGKQIRSFGMEVEKDSNGTIAAAWMTFYAD